MKRLLYYLMPCLTILTGVILILDLKTKSDFISWTNFLIMVLITEFLFYTEDKLNSKGKRK
jgi:hypothetical protein